MKIRKSTCPDIFTLSGLFTLSKKNTENAVIHARIIGFLGVFTFRTKRTVRIQ